MTYIGVSFTINMNLIWIIFLIVVAVLIYNYVNYGEYEKTIIEGTPIQNIPDIIEPQYEDDTTQSQKLREQENTIQSYENDLLLDNVRFEAGITYDCYEIRNGMYVSDTQVIDIWHDRWMELGCLDK